MNVKLFITWVKNTLWKREYDFSRPDPDLFNFHPQIVVLLGIQGIFYERRDSYLRFIWPFLSVNLTLTGVGLQIMFVIHGLETDISYAVECFCYLVLLGVIPLVYYGILQNKDKILNMLNDMNMDFQHVCSLGPAYRKVFLERQLLIWMLCIAWFAFTTVVGIMFMLFPVVMLMYHTMFVTEDEHTTRPHHVFPVWLPNDDPYRTPNYEIFLIFEMCFSVVFVQAFCGYVYLLFHFLIHYLTMMEIMILDIHAIFDNLDPTVALLSKYHPSRMEVQLTLQKRIGRIVTWHLSVLKAISSISSVFGPPLVYQIVFSAITECLIFYKLTDELERGSFNILFAMLAVGCCAQVWIPCYLGTLLRNKGFEVGDTCFYCGWCENPLGQLIRQDILIIVNRAQIPIFIKFIGLPNIELETFSSVMSTSYSYFNMLRQYSN